MNPRCDKSDRAKLSHRIAIVAMFPLALSLSLTSCAVIETTASVAKTTASVVATTVETTVSVAKTTADIGLKTASTAATVGSAAMSAGSAAVSAGAAAKNATAATASVAVAGAVALGSAVKWGVEFSRSEDIEFAAITADGANRFLSKEGSRIETIGCDESRVNQPALLVVNRKGEYSVRTNANANATVNSAGTNATADARSCPVVSINDSKQ
jgi:hypothetical protein